jgi:hypothetical protein
MQMTQLKTTACGGSPRHPFRYEVWDKLEGKITGQVWAADDDLAEEEAAIAASERGCSFVEEVAVYRVNDV